MSNPFPIAPQTSPDRGLVVLCGPAGAGKSTWAARWAPPGAVVSSDRLRGVVSDDESDQTATTVAFSLLNQIADERLKRDLLVVVDSTALEAPHRDELRQLAEKHGRPARAVLFDVPLETLRRRNEQRATPVPERVLERQDQSFRKTLNDIVREGFETIWRADTG